MNYRLARGLYWRGSTPNPPSAKLLGALATGIAFAVLALQLHSDHASVARARDEQATTQRLFSCINGKESLGEFKDRAGATWAVMCSTYYRKVKE